MTQSGNQVTKFETILSQNGQTVSMGSDCGYTAGMSCDLAKGMAFALSNWGGDVSWLTKGKCGGGPTEANLTFSNIEITTGTGSADGCQSGGGGGGGDTGNYTYGDSCAHSDDDDCGSSCSYGQCKWSWPSDDPAQWASSNAKCRCQH